MKVMNRWTVWHLLVSVAYLLVVGRQTALAQGTKPQTGDTATRTADSAGSTDVPESMRQMIANLMAPGLIVAQSLPHDPPVRMSPAVILVNVQTNTVAVTLTNSSRLTLRFALRTQYAPLGDTLRGDSSHSMASWITDVPKELTLAPHERRTVTLHVTPPPSLPAGEYSAHLVGAVNAAIANGVEVPLSPSASDTTRTDSSSATVIVAPRVIVGPSATGPLAPTAIKLVYRKTQ